MFLAHILARLQHIQDSTVIPYRVITDRLPIRQATTIRLHTLHPGLLITRQAIQVEIIITEATITIELIMVPLLAAVDLQEILTFPIITMEALHMETRDFYPMRCFTELALITVMDMDITLMALMATEDGMKIKTEAGERRQKLLTLETKFLDRKKSFQRLLWSVPQLLLAWHLFCH